MKTVAQAWPWYSLCLLLLVAVLELAALLVAMWRKALPRLFMFRLYLGYSFVASVIALAIAEHTPAGSLTLWTVATYLTVGFNVLTFLLCAQIVDHLIRRDDVQRVKRIWLYGLPLSFAIGIFLTDLVPTYCVKTLLTFNAFAALIYGLTVAGTFITPEEDRIPGYRLVILGIGIQTISTMLMKVLGTVFACRVWSTADQLSTAATLVVFLLAATTAKPGPRL